MVFQARGHLVGCGVIRVVFVVGPDIRRHQSGRKTSSVQGWAISLTDLSGGPIDHSAHHKHGDRTTAATASTRKRQPSVGC